MNKFAVFLVKFIAVMAVVAAAAYWLSYFLAASGKKFTFSVKDILPKKKMQAPTEFGDATAACDCSEPVCAVDMCMPY